MVDVPCANRTCVTFVIDPKRFKRMDFMGRGISHDLFIDLGSVRASPLGVI